jgi:hypothetical protein
VSNEKAERCWLCRKILLTPKTFSSVEYPIPLEDVCKCMEPETTSLEERLDAIEEKLEELKNLHGGKVTE